jgi:Tol biopolymer transport system component
MRFATKLLSLQRPLIVAISLAVVLISVACGSATPTLPPASPTLAASGQPTLAEPTAPPTATGPAGATETPPPTPTGSTPVTATVAATRTATVAPTRTPRPTAETQPSPKPAALSGKIAYGVYLGEDYRLRTIQVAAVNATAGAQILTGAAWPAFSPDGTRIAYFGLAKEGIFIANSDGGNPMGPLGITSPGVCCLDWSRDGTWIVFADSPRPSQPGGPIKMLKIDGVFKTIVDLKVFGNGPSFSPDGKHIVWSGCLPNTSTCGLMITPTDGSGSVQVLTRDNGGNAAWSPDGKRIAYQASDGAGHQQVFVINVDGSGGRKQLTNGKGNDGQPAWSRDGGSIFWRSDQNGTAWAIYVMNADGSNPRRLIADAPADPHLWGWQSISVAP